jgi:hypothetical protein
MSGAMAYFLASPLDTDCQPLVSFLQSSHERRSPNPEERAKTNRNEIRAVGQ